jgi:hypothetical protein
MQGMQARHLLRGDENKKGAQGPGEHDGGERKICGWRRGPGLVVEVESLCKARNISAMRTMSTARASPLGAPGHTIAARPPITPPRLKMTLGWAGHGHGHQGV